MREYKEGNLKYAWPEVLAQETEPEYSKNEDNSRFPSEIFLLTKLRDFYRQYETEESKKRVQALKEIETDLNDEGLEATIFVNGSLGFGMSEKKSDIEFIYVGDTSLYSSNDELEEEIGRRVEEKLGYKIEMDINGICDLNKVQAQLKNPEDNFWELIKLYKWNKIDLPLNDSNNPLIMKIERLRDSCLPLNNALNNNGYIPDKSLYRRSFAKYNARLEKRGIELPEDIKSTLKEFANYFFFKFELPTIPQNI